MGLRSGLGGSTGEPLEERRWECIVLEAGVLGSLVVRWPLECALSPQPLETLPKSCSFAASYYPTGLILHHHPKLAHGAPPPSHSSVDSNLLFPRFPPPADPLFAAPETEDFLPRSYTPDLSPLAPPNLPADSGYPSDPASPGPSQSD